MAKASTLDRVFKIGTTEVPDPDPSKDLVQIQDFLSNSYPELTNGTFVFDEVQGSKRVFKHQRKVGTKG